MANSEIFMTQFSDAFKAKAGNTQMISQHRCIDSTKDHYSYVAGSLVDSSELIHKYDLKKNCEYPVEIEFYDYSSDSSLTENTNVSLLIKDFNSARFPISLNSPLRMLFTPEYTIQRFGKLGMRRSAYCDLFRHLETEKVSLYFSAFMKYETHKGNAEGDGLITIEVNLPPFNFTFGHLQANNYL